MAPHDITNETLRGAKERFDAFRLSIWETTSADRGHGGRVAFLRYVPVGSRRFAVVSRVGATVLRLARKAGYERQPLSSVPDRDFPRGFTASRPLGVDHESVAVLVVDRPDRTEDWTGVNDAMKGHAEVIISLAGSTLREGAAQVLLEELRSSRAAFVTGDDLVIGEESPRGRFRPKKVGLVSLLSYDAVGSVVAFSVDALVAVGGFNGELGRLALIDAVARLLGQGFENAHVPAVLATVGAEPDHGSAHAQWSVEQLELRGLNGVAAPTATGTVRWHAKPTLWPSVAIVIPTRDRLDLLERCLASVAQSSYPNYSVIICDNDSSEEATRAFFESTEHVVVPAPGPFNYSNIINRGVAHSDAEFILTLNNDVVVTATDWIERLVSTAHLPGVGPVGCALIEPSGIFNHEGIAISPFPQHLSRARNYTRIDAFLTATREVAAVTGACTLVRRSLFNDLGGLDPTLAVVGNDVDFCLRAGVAGYATVYVADLALIHAESSSRGDLNPPDDLYRMIARWGLFAEFSDPWFPEALQIVADQVVWQGQ